MIKKNITGLNTLRFLCFLVIFINHSTPYFHYGFLAVDFFFTLSGFLITLLALNEIKETGSINRINFFVRRILRIWPLYFFILIVSFFILPIITYKYGLPITLPEKKTYYWLLISNYDFSQHHFALKQLWSIAVEEQFYILFILVSYFLKDHFWKIITALCFSYIFILVYSQSKSGISLYSNTLYHLLSFAAGMVVAKIITGKLYLRISATFMTASIFFFLTILCINNPNLNFVVKVPFSIFSASIILLIAQTQKIFKKYKWLFTVTEQLGIYTYGLYIYSAFIISVGNQLLDWEDKTLLFVTELSCTILVAAISYHFFESRFLRLKEKFRK